MTLTSASRATAAFVLSLTLAASLALSLVEGARYERGYWAAMTVCLVIQSDRSLFLERSVARFLGSVIGAGAGFLLLEAFAPWPWAVVLGFSGWAAGCAAVAMRFRAQRSYVFLLAGYTACIVALGGLAHPAMRETVAVSRIVCTIVGLACALVIGWMFARPAARPDLNDSLQSLAADVTAIANDEIHGARASDAAFGDVLLKIGRLDLATDLLAVASRAGSTAARWARHLAASAVLMLAETRAAAAGPAEPSGAADRNGARGMSLALIGLADGRTSIDGVTPHLLRQVDLASMAIAAGRAFLCLVSAAAVWLGTGYRFGDATVASAAIFLTLFSSQDDPVRASATALKGSLAGAAVAIFYRIGIQPSITTLPALIAATAPFLAAGAWGMSRPDTGKAAIDGTLTFLLIAQPSLLPHPPVADVAARALATLLGVALAVVAYRYILPASPARRMTALAGRMEADAAASAGSSDGMRCAALLDRMVARSVSIGVLASTTGTEIPSGIFDQLSTAARRAARK